MSDKMNHETWGLYLAVKCGFKSLKRIGLIRFQDERPGDFWAEQGYDWYAGL
jgi:DMSO/TMAO reductase YedYZ molybdopterin-dependent catalytic subunit